MYNNFMKLLFLSSLMMGTILSISSNSWLGIWMGLEINLLSIIPMLTNSKNLMINEPAIKYFIIQAMASTMLLISILIIQMKYLMWWDNMNIPSTMIMSSMMMKMGAAPFHFWLPEVMSSTSWINCLMLMTWQKIAPMLILSYCIKMSTFLIMVIMMSIIVGAMGGLNQTSLRQIMAYSSISHLGWMISSMMISENTWELYFLIYSTLNVMIILMFKMMNLMFLNQIYSSSFLKTEVKFMLMTSLLSLGGLPPMLGFLPKWIVIQTLIDNKMTIMVLFMIMFTTITLYYYMRISFSAIILSHNEKSWLMKIKMNKLMVIMPTLSAISMMGLVCTSNIVMLY
uniref:NADH-ubiquinone oxidoreductase chain 2 n=2 Tax=Acrididae TaxID=7002 RepID=A0A6G6A5Q2_9ORTH|nr:NADH dehydrogenase subunit 2 [Oedaleus abruptus]YP_009740667.1 NADH dehydrogenase subunit 2 [Mecostethus alliaceus]QID03616.1 NADH dehydrogenase subunit 2 [Oedaleus abruptus]QID03629.1 NADH dehydrogenase subunit 2 [Mecostethus alliaceus]UPL65163.1 NADH dehydrogenase subunit 2 [Oedaleus abruptus]